MTTIAFNPKVDAGTQFTNYNFTDFVTIGGVTYGLNSDGMFSLDTKADDNGTDIDAYFAIVMTNLGISNQKRVRSGIISGEGGEIKVIIIFDDDSEHTEFVTPSGTGAGIFHGIRTQKGEYFQLKIQNIDGSDFSIDQIDVRPLILGLKPRGSDV